MVLSAYNETRIGYHLFKHVEWERARSERYCVETGFPVRMATGDRCLRHKGGSTACYTAMRNPRCTHPTLSPDHPYPLCDQCGRSGAVVMLSDPPQSHKKYMADPGC